MNLKNLSFIVLLATITQSCRNESAEPVEVCFQRDVQPILVNSCAYGGCHNPNDRAGGLQLTTYNGIRRAVKPGNYRSSKLYLSMVTYPIMPPNPYDRIGKEDLALIAAWIEQGAKNDTCAPVNCDTSNVSLSSDVRPILSKYCGGCHQTSNPQGNVDFRTYEDLRIFVEDGSLISSINQVPPFSPMPKGSGRIPTCDIRIIESWVANGARNN